MKTARQQWADLIDSLVESGMSRLAASKRVAAEHPHLRTAVVEEANYRPRAPMFKVNAMAAEVEWRDLVDSFVARGYTRQRAAVLANRKQPKLRARAIASFNARQASSGE